MKNFPSIKTNRLILDKLSLKNASIITKYLQEKDMSKYTLNIPYPYFEKDAIWWINNSFEIYKNNNGFVFGIYNKNSNVFIGAIGLNVDHKNQRALFGYWIAKDFWNKGYMTEALKAIINFGFNNLQLNKIYAQHLIENTASGKVMQKAGMVKEAELKEHNIKDGVFRSLYQYRILKSEFINQNKRTK